MTQRFGHAGVLPVALNPTDNEIYFLLGREHYARGWRGSEKWSTFGGKPEAEETPIQAAAREAYEESMAFLGDQEHISEAIRDTIYIYWKDTYTYIIMIQYDENMVQIYNRLYQYLNRCTRPRETPYRDDAPIIPTCPEGYVEKSEFKWIRHDILKSMINDPRNSQLPLRNLAFNILKRMFWRYSFANGKISSL